MEVTTELPSLGDEAQLILVLERILQVREIRLRNKTIREYLVQWKDLLSEGATWKCEHILKHLGLQLLEEKQS